METISETVSTKNLGKLGRDKITGFEGIAVTQLVSLFGCMQYGLAPTVYDKEKGKRGDTEYFDEGRVDFIGEGVNAKDVKVAKGGADFNSDAPKS